MTPRPPQVSLHIECLAIEGLSLQAHHAGAVRAAVAAEVRRLLAAFPPEPAGLRSAPRAGVNDARLRGLAGPGQIGRQIGRSVHAALVSPDAGNQRGHRPGGRT